MPHSIPSLLSTYSPPMPDHRARTVIDIALVSLVQLAYLGPPVALAVRSPAASAMSDHKRSSSDAGVPGYASSTKVARKGQISARATLHAYLSRFSLMHVASPRLALARLAHYRSCAA